SLDSYPAARLVAPKVHTYFARHQAAASPVATLAPVPDEGVIRELIDAAFWASLRREEGYEPKISLAYLPPEQDQDALVFERPLPLRPATLAKIAPVVERAGIHLGVWHMDGELCVWGTTQAVPVLCFVLEVIEAGLLVVKHHRGVQAGKYVNVAVLEGDQVKLVDESASTLPDCPDLLTSLLGFNTARSWVGSVNVLVQLAVSMRAHGRGGSLLIVPAGSDEWRESIVHPMTYAVSPPFVALSKIIAEATGGVEPRGWQDSFKDAIDAVAGLTAVDGAAVLADNYDLLAFGAKITRRRGSPLVEQVTVTEPIEGGSAVIATPAELGGTRHLSAAQFVHDQRGAVALVASQDRRFTVFAWSPCETRVHAHRVESLLL
ncbi:MAG TPA: hypothetical protein VIY56_19165, partial [Vicinamibacterales bacterium]